jgi:hypothetical protein
MKGIIWNSNEFRDPKKHRFVSDTTREHNLVFTAILETGGSKNLYSGKNFLWHCKAPQGRWHSSGCRLRYFSYWGH